MQTGYSIQIKKMGKDRLVLAGLCFAFSALAFFAPVWPGNSIEPHLGGLLTWVAIIEIYDSFRRSIAASRKSAQKSGAFSLLMGFLLLNAELFQNKALYVFIIIVFVLDAGRYFYQFYKETRDTPFYWFNLVACIGNLLLLLALVLLESKGEAWALSIAVSIRMVGVGINLLVAKAGVVGEDVVSAIGLSEGPYVREIAEKIEKEETAAAPYDRNWITTFIILLFVIHIGRMGLDRSYLGLLSPGVATIGDLVIALVIAYAIIGPLRFGLLKISSAMEKPLWKWVSKVDEKEQKKSIIRNIVYFWLTNRMRTEIRLEKQVILFPLLYEMVCALACHGVHYWSQ